MGLRYKKLHIQNLKRVGEVTFTVKGLVKEGLVVGDHNIFGPSIGEIINLIKYDPVYNRSEVKAIIYIDPKSKHYDHRV